MVHNSFVRCSSIGDALLFGFTLNIVQVGIYLVIKKKKKLAFTPLYWLLPCF